MRITENFNLSEIEYSEVAIRSGIHNRIPIDSLDMCFQLFENIMQPLRDKVGKIRITSGYRSQRLNEMIGGSLRSQHVYSMNHGAACDFVSMKKTVSNISLVNNIISMQLPFDQLILEYFKTSPFNGWVHVSVAGMDKEPRRQILAKEKGKPYILIDNKNKYGVKLHAN